MNARDAADAARDALDELAFAVAEALTAEAPRDELAAVLAILDRAGDHDPGCSQRLAAVVYSLKAGLAVRLEFAETLTVEGVGVLQQAASGRSYAYDGRRLAHLVALQVADQRDVDPATGEVTPVPPAVLAGRVADALIAAGGLDNKSAGWRSGALKERGIDPEQYREVSNPGKPGVRWLD